MIFCQRAAWILAVELSERHFLMPVGEFRLKTHIKNLQASSGHEELTDSGTIDERKEDVMVMKGSFSIVGFFTRLVFLVVLLTLFCIPFGPAEAGDIFFDNFESYTVGTFPSSGGWTIIHNGAGNTQQYVDTAHAVSGIKSLRSMGSSCWCASLSKALTIPVKVRLEGKVFVDQLVYGGCSVVIAQLGLWRTDDSMNAGLIIFGRDGNIYAQKQTGHPNPSSNLVLLTSYTPGQWYDVRVDLDYSSKTFDVYIDDTLVGSAIPILDDLTDKMPNAVRVGAGHNANPVAWFDDVRVTEILPDCVEAPSDLVSWWSGDGTSLDIVGENEGSLENGATYAEGKVDKAFSLDGVNDHVSIPDGIINYTSRFFTVDAWVFPKGDQSGDHKIFYAGAEGGEYNLFYYNGRFGFGVHLLDGSWYGASTAETFAPGAWYHVTGVRRGTTIEIWVNGVLKKIESIPDLDLLVVPGFHSSIGSSNGGDGGFFNGLIDEVELFDRALGGEEILAIYNAGGAGKCKPCVTPPEDLVSWWTGEETAEDIIGTNDGSLINGVTYTEGRVGKAFSFDGVDDYVDAGVSDEFNFNGGTGDFTIDAWIKPNSMPSWSAGIVAKATGYPWSGWGFYFLYDGGIAFGNVGVGEVASAPGVITAGEWAHVAVTKAGDTIRLYKNGSEVVSAAYGNVATSTSSLKIGRVYPTDSTHPGHPGDVHSFSGIIDEVEIFHRALTSEEIAAIHAAGSAGKCLPVDGKCGSASGGTFTSAPTVDLCEVGTATPVLGTGPWTWTCEGINGGATANCSANIQQNTLTVTKNGTGSGTVNATGCSLNWSNGTGTCTANYGTAISLHGSPQIGSTFAGWSGGSGSASGCSGTGDCDFNLTEDSAVTATFTLNRYNVTAEADGTGAGSVSSNPEGIDYEYPATDTGSAEFDHGTNLVLTATASAGSTASWTSCAGTVAGNGTGTATCSFASLDGGETAKATFNRIQLDGPDLTGGWQSLLQRKFLGRYHLNGKLQVKNIGNRNAKSFKVNYHLSDDGLTLGKLLKTTYVSGLKAGKSTYLCFSYASSKDSLRGKYVIAVIDSANTVAETNEDNNRAAAQIK